MNPVAFFEIQSAAPEAAMSFYGNVFGWTFERQDSAPVDYWQIQGGGINGGLLRRPAPVPPPQTGTNAYVCSMQVEDFDETASAILAAGGQAAMYKFAVPGKCWQGYFIDLDGNTFGLFEIDETAA